MERHINHNTHIRNLLTERLRSDADFNAFCQDWFPGVFFRFTQGMDRIAKTNLLLEQVQDPQAIVDNLVSDQKITLRKYEKGSKYILIVLLTILGTSVIAWVFTHSASRKEINNYYDYKKFSTPEDGGVNAKEEKLKMNNLLWEMPRAQVVQPASVQSQEKIIIPADSQVPLSPPGERHLNPHDIEFSCDSMQRCQMDNAIH